MSCFDENGIIRYKVDPEYSGHISNCLDECKNALDAAAGGDYEKGEEAISKCNQTCTRGHEDDPLSLYACNGKDTFNPRYDDAGTFVLANTSLTPLS